MDTGNTNSAGGDAHPYDWLWTVFAIMLLSWIITWFWTSLVRPSFPLIRRFLILLPAVSLKSDFARRSVHRPRSINFHLLLDGVRQGVIVPSEPVSHATCLVWVCSRSPVESFSIVSSSTFETSSK